MCLWARGRWGNEPCFPRSRAKSMALSGSISWVVDLPQWPLWDPFFSLSRPELHSTTAAGRSIWSLFAGPLVRAQTKWDRKWTQDFRRDARNRGYKLRSVFKMASISQWECLMRNKWVGACPCYGNTGSELEENLMCFCSLPCVLKISFNSSLHHSIARSSLGSEYYLRNIIPARTSSKDKLTRPPPKKQLLSPQRSDSAWLFVSRSTNTRQQSNLSHANFSNISWKRHWWVVLATVKFMPQIQRISFTCLNKLK